MISQTSNEIASQGSWRVVVVVVTVVDLEPSRLAESTPVARKKKEKKPKREKEREGETIQGRGRHRWKLSCRSTRDQLPSPLFIPAAPLEKVETNYFFFVTESQLWKSNESNSQQFHRYSNFQSPKYPSSSGRLACFSQGFFKKFSSQIFRFDFNSNKKIEFSTVLLVWVVCALIFQFRFVVNASP